MFVAALFGSAVPASAGAFLTLESADAGVRVKVIPSKASAEGLLEVVEDKTGRCVRTLHAGAFPAAGAYTLGKNNRLPAGRYRFRYREGLSLVPDTSLALPRKEKWINPTDLVLTEKAIYVYDQGRVPISHEAESPMYCFSSGVEGPFENTPYIYKFGVDGAPDVKFGDQGRLGPLKPGDVRSFGVDEAGWIHVGSGEHEVEVYNPSGEVTPTRIGGYTDTGPDAKKVTMGVNSVVCGPGKRLYLPGMFGDLMVYDRTKPGFDGFLYSARIVGDRLGMHRCLASDGEGGVYAVNWHGTLQKFHDTGKALVAAYEADSSIRLSVATGLSASAGIVWLANHGGPPLWDSDGGEVVMCWDDGQTIALIQRFGSPGSALDKLQFMNPAAVVPTPDHLGLWVVEDGLANVEGAPGNARVRRFKLDAAKSEEIPFDWRGP